MSKFIFNYVSLEKQFLLNDCCDVVIHFYKIKNKKNKYPVLDNLLKNNNTNIS